MMFEQYKYAIESNNITSKTDINGIITFVNDEFCTISGYSRDELIGQNHNIVRHPDVPKSTFKKMWQTILAKKTYKATVKNRAKNGKTFYVNTTIFPILNETGAIEEFLAIRYDVTAEVELRMALEKEIAKNEEKQKIMLWQARHATFGQMLACIAHQWRQPLTELNLELYNLMKAVKEHENTNQDLHYNNAKLLIQHISTTIENFRNFFKPDKQKVNFLIGDAVYEATNLMQQQLQKNNITITCSLGHIVLFGVVNEFTQVIINLLQNSKEAFEQNNITQNREIKIKVFQNSNIKYIQIEDNAGGIPNDTLEQIFEPYFTTKQNLHGTGLGLFMSKLVIAQSFDGNIKVENTINGALFSISMENI